ncbi:MAG TPA: thiamine phosphate synthase [Solibacterales bacterium]|nr:thiamine phosphate synthase [Bryobacterales bacterium]
MVLPAFYPIVDTTACERRGCAPVVLAEALLEAGVRLLQYRRKDVFTRAAFEEASTIAALCRGAGATLIVDDRADIARLLEAGVHLGQDDLLPAAARRVLGDSLPLGFSTHNEAQLRDAATEPADYLALGPIFRTASKDRPDAEVGLEGLRRWRPLASRPLVAIGGIARENARAVLAAGADSVAVIADLFPERCDRISLLRRAEEWLSVTTVL